MNAHDLFMDLERQGFSLRAEGAGIRVTPASRLTAAERDRIRACRNGLLALLRRRQDDEVACRIMEQDMGLPAGTLRLYTPREQQARFAALFAEWRDGPG